MNLNCGVTSMSIFVNKSRRQFLIGTGQTLLALPLLPSLFASEAEAQMAFDNQRKLMLFWTDHANAPEYWPARSFANTAIGNSGTMERLLSQLPSATAINPLMSHSIYNTLRQQNLISIVRGLDVQRGGGHGAGPLGGVYDYNAGALVTGSDSMPTFDSVIDSSSSVYPSTTPSYVTRGIRIGFTGAPAQYLRKVGTTFQPIPYYGYDGNTYYNQERYYTLTVLYNEVFRGLTGGTVTPVDTTNQLKTNILNRVFQSYSSFRNNRRISTDDRSRLEQHMSFISDLQSRLNTAITPVTVTCNRPANPPNTLDPLVFTPLYVDLLAIAFKCGLTKFGALYFDSHSPSWLPGLNLPQGLELHGAIHGSNSTELPHKRHAYETYHRYALDLIANRFLAPLNELEGNTGRTYIDNMVTVYLTQMGMEPITGGSSHTSYDMQQMMIGSMGGRMRAGRYMALPNNNGRLLPYNAFLVTLLQLMGVAPNEYSHLSNTGQGYGYYNSTTGNPFAARYYQPITELLV
jgi:hypothetical protein